MSSENRFADWLRPAVFLGHNPITLAGAVLTTTGAITTIGYWLVDVTRATPLSPYASIIGYFVLPGVFVVGLLLMPFGAILRRRKLARAGELPSVYPRIDLEEPLFRRGLLWVSGLTLLNIALVGFAAYRGVAFMDSPHFCGETCHSVMGPEYAAYRESPHSRVECVGCHVGPGLEGLVRSKLAGTRQLFSIALKSYSRPIPSPVEDLRPARETCEHCHWPQKFHGDKFIVSRKYASDEANTPATSVLVLRLGGIAWNGRIGIHGRHIDDVERISYVATDRQRQTIPVVEWIDESGKKIRFVSKDSKTTPAELEKASWRKMDCMDCHNRPTHAFDLPERAVDRAMATGRISIALPFVKKTAVELLRAEYSDQDEAEKKITAAFSEYYRANHTDLASSKKAEIDSAAAQIVKIYRRNVFPHMKIFWGTHPNNIGHDDFPGCFRCHDDNHVAEDGRTISGSCDACHTLLAQEEQNPKILADLGLEP